MTQKPYILSDNLFDDGVLHPTHIVSMTGTPIAGSESFRVADNLRDMTRCTIVEMNTQADLTVDCGAATLANTIILDRGHNLAGKTIVVRTSSDAAAYADHITCVIPAAAGGLPTEANGALSPSGVWWKTFTADTKRGWQLRINAMGAGLAPLLTGVYLGAGYRFAEYLDAPGAYDHRRNHKVLKNELSWAGVRVKRRILNFYEVHLRTVLEEADFTALLPHVTRMLEYGHPWWFCLDDSAAAGAALMRLYQLPGDTVFDPVVDPVYRVVELQLEEVIPALTI